jgi:hypothetical protein
MMKERSHKRKQLRAQAAVEQDPQKLLELTRKINDLLLGKQKRLDSVVRDRHFVQSWRRIVLQ